MPETKNKEAKAAAQDAGGKSKPVKAAKADKADRQGSDKGSKQSKAAKEAPKVQEVSKAADMSLWTLAAALIVAAIGGNFYYIRFVSFEEGTLERLMRVGSVIALILIGLGVTLFTNKGHALIAFAREAYVELRKVVWPTRQEATQTTLIIFVAVCIVSLFLYLCDLVFLEMVKVITL